MRLKTITAPDMPTALKRVRESLGEEAIIVSSRTDKLTQMVTVTAAIDQPEDAAAPPQPVPPPAAKLNLEQKAWIDGVRELLEFHNAPSLLAAHMADKAAQTDLGSLLALQKLSAKSSRGAIEAKALQKVLEACFRFEPIDFGKKAQRLMLIGQPGIGKTLSVAKLAAQLAVDKKPMLVITTDTKRAGGIEQLSAFTNILDCALHVAEDRKALWRLLQETSPETHVLIDTSGCNPYDKDDVEELDSLLSLTGIEPVFTMPAGMDASEAIDAAKIFAGPQVRRMLVTRADITRRFGAILAVAHSRKLAFAALSDTSRIVGELKPFGSHVLAQLLLHYKAK